MGLYLFGILYFSRANFPNDSCIDRRAYSLLLSLLCGNTWSSIESRGFRRSGVSVWFFTSWSTNIWKRISYFVFTRDCILYLQKVTLKSKIANVFFTKYLWTFSQIYIIYDFTNVVKSPRECITKVTNQWIQTDEQWRNDQWFFNKNNLEVFESRRYDHRMTNGAQSEAELLAD